MGMSEIEMFKRYKSDFSKLSWAVGGNHPCYNDMIRTEAYYPSLIRSPTIRTLGGSCFAMPILPLPWQVGRVKTAGIFK